MSIKTGPTCGPKAVSMTVPRFGWPSALSTPVRTPARRECWFPLPPRRDRRRHYRYRERPGSISRRGPAPNVPPQRSAGRGALDCAALNDGAPIPQDAPRRGAQPHTGRSVALSPCSSFTRPYAHRQRTIQAARGPDTGSTGRHCAQTRRPPICYLTLRALGNRASSSSAAGGRGRYHTMVRGGR